MVTPGKGMGHGSEVVKACQTPKLGGVGWVIRVRERSPTWRRGWLPHPPSLPTFTPHALPMLPTLPSAMPGGGKPAPWPCPAPPDVRIGRHPRAVAWSPGRPGSRAPSGGSTTPRDTPHALSLMIMSSHNHYRQSCPTLNRPLRPRQPRLSPFCPTLANLADSRLDNINPCYH